MNLKVVLYAAVPALLCVISVSGEYSWNQSQAQATEQGDLIWTPEAYSYTPGSVIRYIDYENGDDSNSGASTSAPWKHHPWDDNAVGNAQGATGIDTYVFKGGVVYRGILTASESGTPSNPIRLCTDPAWGGGKASIWGSVRITNGWLRGDALTVPGVADPTNVWYQDIGTNVSPRGLWLLEGSNSTPVVIAREPDWEIDHPLDIHTQWYQWTEDRMALVDPVTGETNQYCVDSNNLTVTDANYYAGAQVWTEQFISPYGNMDAECITTIENYLPDEHALLLGSLVVQKGQRYYIENALALLDQPGEFYFSHDLQDYRDSDLYPKWKYPDADLTNIVDETVAPGRLYVRLPGDVNPNGAIVELAVRAWPLRIYDQSHIEVRNMDFRYVNDHFWGDSWLPSFKRPTCVRMIGSCTNLTISHCNFYDVPSACVALPRPGQLATKTYLNEFLSTWKPDRMDDIEVTDSDIRRSNRTAIEMVNGSWLQNKGGLQPDGWFGKARIMRNRFYDIAFRHGSDVYSICPAVEIDSIEQGEVAGNIIEFCMSAGIDVRGGTRASFTAAPLRRYLIYNNKVTGCMLGQNDYGGIEGWNNGPMYFYNNKSGNAIGYKENRYFDSLDDGDDPLDDDWLTQAPSYYLDGGYKNFLFNNIAWGHDGSMTNRYRTRMAFNMVKGFMNHWFNNTSYDLVYAFSGSPGDRNSYLANVLAESHRRPIDLGRADDLTVAGGGGDSANFINRLALGYNVYHGPAEQGLISLRGEITGDTIAEIEQSAAEHADPPRFMHAGWLAETLPLQDPENDDFSLADSTPALDTGVKFFVPWALYKTVGEWNFYQDHNDPTRILGEAINETREYMDRDMYYDIPLLSLTASFASLDSYADGPLEDWISGALTFDGISEYCSASDAEMKSDYIYSGRIETNYYSDGTMDVSWNGSDWIDGATVYYTSTWYGVDRETLDMDTNSFLIEIIFESELAGQEGVLVSKLDAQGGYRLALNTNGVPELTLRSGGHDESITAGPAVADSDWIHLLVEIDRISDTVLFHIDGVTVSTNTITLTAAASLTNSADFYVGKDSSGNYFKGAVDFLRISRGTLADAKTTIDELYEWEFNGPFLRDFTGTTAVKRDGGALDSGKDSLIETSVNSLLVQEGSTTNFTVWLNTQPLGTVTVDVARVSGGDTNIIVQSGGTLVFTITNWDIPQPVTLAATADADDLHETAIIRCSTTNAATVDVYVTESDTGAPAMVVRGGGLIIENSDNAPASADGTDFGTQPLDTVVTNVFEITNEGGGSLVLTNILLSYDRAFTLLDDLSGTVLTNGQSAEFRVAFAPSSTAELFLDAFFADNDTIGQEYHLPGSTVDTGWYINATDQWIFDAANDRVLHIGDASKRSIGQIISGPGADATDCTLKVYYKVADTTLGSGAEVHISLWGFDGSGDISGQTMITLSAYGNDPGVYPVAPSNYIPVALVNQEFVLTGTGEDYTSTPRIFTNLDLSACEYLAVRLGMDPGGTGDAFDEAYFSGASLELPDGQIYELSAADISIPNSDVLRTPYTFSLAGTGGYNPAVDEDGDGLPNEWEVQYYGGSTNASPNVLSSNGINTVMQCYIAGLDPTDSAARFRLSNVRNALTWSMTSGRVYTIWWTSNLMSSFQALETNFTAGMFTDVTHGVDDKGYYKIDVKLAP